MGKRPRADLTEEEVARREKQRAKQMEAVEARTAVVERRTAESDLLRAILRTQTSCEMVYILVHS